MASEEARAAAGLKLALRAMRDYRQAQMSTDEVRGLRERKKRQTRQQISDVATGMFLTHGFDSVRVSDVAEACGVSEKTVYNYFPTKESLMLDREEAMIEMVERSLGPDAPAGSPVEVFVERLIEGISETTDFWASLPEDVSCSALMRRFQEVVESTPSLRAAQLEMMSRVEKAAAEALAARAGVDPGEPEPRIAAAAICGLWAIQYYGLTHHATAGRAPAEVRDLVEADVRRAARLIDTGLWSFGQAVQGRTGAQQMKQAAEAANEARKQVITALRAARAAWEQMAAETREQRASQRRRAGGSS